MERRLSAILAADVVGYSRLMGEDETSTLAALKKLRAELVDRKIAEHQGRIVKLTGDGLLVDGLLEGGVLGLVGETFGLDLDVLALGADGHRHIDGDGAAVEDVAGDDHVAQRLGVDVVFAVAGVVAAVHPGQRSSGIGGSP